MAARLECPRQHCPFLSTKQLVLPRKVRGLHPLPVPWWPLLVAASWAVVEEPSESIDSGSPLSLIRAVGLEPTIPAMKGRCLTIRPGSQAPRTAGATRSDATTTKHPKPSPRSQRPWPRVWIRWRMTPYRSSGLPAPTYPRESFLPVNKLLAVYRNVCTAFRQALRRHCRHIPGLVWLVSLQ